MRAIDGAIFAVAACGGAVKSQNEVALYVERLRARRASTQVHAYGCKNWLPKARVRQHKVEFRRSSTSTHTVRWRDLNGAATAVSVATNFESRSFNGSRDDVALAFNPGNPYRNGLFFFCVTKFHSRSPYYQRTCHAAIRPLAVAGVPATRASRCLVVKQQW